MKSYYRFNEELELYFGNKTNYWWIHSLWGLFSNAYRVINSVYRFKHFDEFCRQLDSDREEDKMEIYWAASYDEKLIDYIKIVVAFETMNKAMLIEKGYLIHKVDPKYDKALYQKQLKGIPITLEEFYKGNRTNLDPIENEATPNGLAASYSTINFSHTLNDQFQEILQLDEGLVYHLKAINQKRNRLHFYSDFVGAFEVSSHIAKWRYIKENSIGTIEKELRRINQELKNHNVYVTELH